MYSIISLGHSEAQRVLQAVQDELARREKAAVVAVADAYGELIVLLRMDGAPLASIQIAANKAWTAARERMPTLQLGQLARHPQHGFDMAYYGDSRYVGWGGGVPVFLDGAVVGAIAVSGLSEEEDEQLALQGLAVIPGAAGAPIE